MKLISYLLLCAILFMSSLEGINKVGFGPAYVHVDLLQSGHTRNQIDMLAVKADSTLLIDCGVCFKPTVLYGEHNRSHLFIGGAGIGFYYPLNDYICLTPIVGWNYTYLNAPNHLHVAGASGIVISLHKKEISKSSSPYVALDATLKITDSFRIGGSIQYAWSRTKTHISQCYDGKSKSTGFAYSFMLEKDINQQFSVDLAVGYNSTLSHEKHGLRGYGGQLALAYWF